MTMDVYGHLFSDCTRTSCASTRSPRRSTPLDPRLPDPPPLLPMLKILLPKCCQTPMWSTWPPTSRKVKPQVRRRFLLAPPARFELALPPPEGGALSPELRGRASFGKPGPLEGRMAMYQRAGGEPLAVAAVTFCRFILDLCRAVSGALTPRG
jgi:hypothetical protein